MKKVLIFLMLILPFLICIYVAIKSDVRIYRVSSSSMEPKIKNSSLIVVSKNNEYRVGDVITYKTYQNDIPVTHRVIKIEKLNNKYYLTTKGDGNEKEDPYPVLSGEIVGKVVTVVPFLGMFPELLISYKFVWLTIYLPLGILLGRYLAKLIKEMEMRD